MRTVKRKPGLSRPAAAVILALAALALLAILLLSRVGRSKPQPEELPDVERSQAVCVVCLDPGHGGEDNGAVAGERVEKADNLAIALALRDALLRRNVYVVMTRAEDATLSLQDRVDVAEEEQADLFLSLHRNSAEGANGVEIWVAERASDASRTLAQALDDALASVGVQNNRGVRSGAQSGSGSYYVLRKTTMPAVLVELGFVQDREDNRLFDDHLEDYAEAMAEAIVTFWSDRS